MSTGDRRRLATAVVVYAWRSRGELDIDAPLLTREFGLDTPYARWIPAITREAARLVVVVDRDGVDAYSDGGAAGCAAHLAGPRARPVPQRAALRDGHDTRRHGARRGRGDLDMIIAALAIPFGLGLLLLVLRNAVSGRVAAVLGSAAMAASLVLYALVWEGRSVRVSGEVDTSWIEPLGARLHLGVTYISWPFLLMTAVLGLLCCVWLIAEDTSPALVGLVLVISASALGVFSSLDLLLFFVFFELALIPMWFVIAWWGDPHDPVGRRRAATRFLLFTVTGSALLLVGIVWVAGPFGSLQILDIDGAALGRRDPDRPRVRGQDAAGAAAHVAAGRTQQGTDGRLGSARRRVPQARHVRTDRAWCADAPRGVREDRAVRRRLPVSSASSGRRWLATPRTTSND